MARFYSNRPYLYLAYKLIPNFPITSQKMLNSGVDFNANCEFETNDKMLIECLKLYIEARKGKYCPIWEEGSEPPPTAIEAIENPVVTNDKAEEFEEFKRLLRI